jgi:hypothetical protein
MRLPCFHNFQVAFPLANSINRLSDVVGVSATGIAGVYPPTQLTNGISFSQS